MLTVYCDSQDDGDSHEKGALSHVALPPRTLANSRFPYCAVSSFRAQSENGNRA